MQMLPLRLVWRRTCGYSTATMAEKNIKEPERPDSYLFVASTRTPYSLEPDLDFRYRLKDLNRLKALLQHRDCRKEEFRDLNRLANQYYEWYNSSVEFLEKYPTETRSQLNSDPAELARYKDQKGKLETLRSKCILACLRLPAELHESTPLGELPELWKVFVDGTESADNALPHRSKISHLEALKEDVSFAGDPEQCFLLGLASSLLWKLQDYCRLQLNANSYRPVSPAHFVRSSIIEAHSGNVDPDDMIGIESLITGENQDTKWGLNLAGHGPYAYLALFARKVLGSKNRFPLRFFSTGMRYRTESADTAWDNLFDFNVQRPIVTTWSMAGDDVTDAEIYDGSISSLVDILRELKLTFALERVGSAKLGLSETGRTEFTVRTFNGESRRLGWCAYYGDFLSRRIRLIVLKNDQEEKKLSADVCRYARCCYGELDLYAVLAAIYEQMHPSDNRKGDWEPHVLRSV